MIQIAAGVSVGGCLETGVRAAQVFEAAGLLGATPVGGGEVAIQAIAIPAHARADHLVETQRGAGCGNVEMGAGAHQDEARALLSVSSDRAERVRKDPLLQERRDESG